ncbi:hypothetical protein MLD38_032458 [Melastoma candidum]|uniref:Uncharacterized protein n=1 Tax=Melastoma candidum TaxID=119954 RepID=A0ACB9M5H6_9MYRT|nr:hypothetical protein MLD38_032458 [Melastoma candidum]
MVGGGGRRNAQVAALLAGMLAMFVHSEFALGDTYVVGSGRGLEGTWTDNVERWTEGIHFKAGDLLVFKYDPAQQNVVLVDKQGYYSCRVSPPDAQLYNSGNDTIKVLGGMNYFMSSIQNHCYLGTKIAVRGYDS